MIEIDLTRKRVAITLIVILLLLAVLGTNLVSYLANYDWRALAAPTNCYITPPVRGTELAETLAQLPEVATTDYAPGAAKKSKTTAYILLCDGQTYERRLFVSYQEGYLPVEYIQGGYLVSIVTAEVTMPYPTPKRSPESNEAYPP